MKHVYIIGSRGLPAKYGGFETFVQQLVSHQQTEKISYHVACLSDTSHQPTIRPTWVQIASQLIHQNLDRLV
ncbi:Glycosyltransferase [Streptococcus suis 05ZYH33]|nr:Glycosyltransferase [Streptococcus suis 05ZYH33]